MRHSDKIRPFPSMEEMLRQLQDDGVRAGSRHVESPVSNWSPPFRWLTILSRN